VLATSFHPEVSGDDRIHELFLSMVQSPVSDGVAPGT